ncbi:glycoside hydrolase family 127 protein [soil metagenome]
MIRKFYEYTKRKVLLLAAGFAVNICAFNMLHAQQKLYPNEFNLSDVVLLDGPFKHARDLNIQTLLKYNVDRLLAPYLTEAGLMPKDSSYKNWDGLDGHIGGHYLTAMAINTATGNAECKKRMLYMIAQMKTCQQASAKNNSGWGIGYVGGVPNSKAVWTSIQNGDMKAFHEAWVPWYNVHKTYAGLRDAWAYTGNEEAKIIFLKFCDWATYITSNLTDEQMQSMLDTEQGGMNEVLADAYQITGNEKYLVAAKRFSHKMLLDPMSKGVDNLDNKHANTQVPKAVGFERIGELSGDEKYIDAGSFFWQTVTDNRSLAFGGNSRREFFPGAAASTDFINDVEGPESCNSYNMLKLTEDLFRINPSAKYIDYYERTMYNHILSTQNPETGGYVYFTPARPRSYRVYSAPNEAMWCCVGTGMENHGKYNQLIYTHTTDSLYVNLFVESELNWTDKKIKLKQETTFPYEEKTKFVITEGASSFSLLIRYPAWVADSALKIKLNGKDFAYKAHPSSYITIKRQWKKGDVVEVGLPMHNTIEHLPNVPQYIAIMHGPILLGAKTGTQDLKGLIADDSRWGQIASGEKLPIDKAPVIIENDLNNLTTELIPVKDKPLTFTIPAVKLENPIEVTLQPFYSIHNARYMMYWMASSNNGYKSYIDSLSVVEELKIELDKRTIDFVAPGEQQPETDHSIQNEKSRTGNNQDQMFRQAFGGGYFSYSMNTNNQTGLSLIVRYWGAEWGKNKFDIYIDNEKLVTEDNTGKWNQSAFKDITYKIPDAMVKGKSHVRVKFEAAEDAGAGPVYYIRLVASPKSPSLANGL